MRRLLNDPPLRLGLPTAILPKARDAYLERQAAWKTWEDVSNAAMSKPNKTTAAWSVRVGFADKKRSSSAWMVRWLRGNLEIVKLRSAPACTQRKHTVRMRRIVHCGELGAIEPGHDLLSMKA